MQEDSPSPDTGGEGRNNKESTEPNNEASNNACQTKSNDEASLANHTKANESQDSNFKPIKIDNWSAFVFHKLHLLFIRGDACDLELRFSDATEPLQTHCAVVQACTDFFKKNMKEEEGGRRYVEVPLEREATEVMVHFMYTGKLAISKDNAEKLYIAAQVLGLSVLVNLIGSQMRQALAVAKAAKDQNERAGPSRLNLNSLPKIEVSNQVERFKKLQATTNSTNQHTTSSYNNVSKKEDRAEITNVSSGPTKRKAEDGNEDSLEKKQKMNQDLETLKVDDIADNAGPAYKDNNSIVKQKIRYRILDDSKSEDEESESESSSDETVESVKSHSTANPWKSILKHKFAFAQAKKPLIAKKVSFSLPENHTDGPKKKYEEIKQKAAYPPRSRLPSNNRARDMPIKRLTSSDVFLKYSGASKSSTANNDQSASAVTEILKKNPNLVKVDQPVKLKLTTEEKATGHKKTTCVTVKAVEENGEKKIQIIHSPNDKPPATEPIPSEGPWYCKLCKRKSRHGGGLLEFDSYYGCRYHHANIHGQKFDPKICEYCGFKSSKRLILAHHQLVKHDISPPPGFEFFRCKKCKYVSITKEVLERHMKKEHTDNEQKFSSSPWKGSGLKFTTLPTIGKLEDIEKGKGVAKKDDDEVTLDALEQSSSAETVFPLVPMTPVTSSYPSQTTSNNILPNFQELITSTTDNQSLPFAQMTTNSIAGTTSSEQNNEQMQVISMAVSADYDGDSVDLSNPQQAFFILSNANQQSNDNNQAFYPQPVLQQQPDPSQAHYVLQDPSQQQVLVASNQDSYPQPNHHHQGLNFDPYLQPPNAQFVYPFPMSSPQVVNPPPPTQQSAFNPSGLSQQQLFGEQL